MSIKEHKYINGCETGDCGGICPLCTLSVCEVCGLYEGSLTTECCGKTVSKELENRVYAGEIDFRNGEWIEGMRNRVMYGHPEEDIVHEKRYLKMLLDANALDFERVKDSKNMVNRLRGLLDY